MISSRGQRAARGTILLALSLFAILPLLSMLTTALSVQGSSPPGLAWPDHPQWHNFVDAWTAANFFALFRSSAVIALVVVPVAVSMATAAGYALAQFRVPGGKVMYFLLLLGLTLPLEALITPLYFEIRDMGLLGSRWAIILPLIALQMPFGVVWMRAHFLTAPPSLTEAALIDGATSWQVFRRIHLPLSTPAWSALIILFFLATWNQYLLPLVLVDDPTKRTVAGGLAAFQGQYRTNIALLCAGSLLVVAPVIVIFVVFQRSFVKALLQGSLK